MGLLLILCLISHVVSQVEVMRTSIIPHPSQNDAIALTASSDAAALGGETDTVPQLPRIESNTATLQE